MPVGKGEFVNDNGKQESYYKNGKIKRKANYKKNQKDGKETFWSKNGKIHKENIYKNGKLISTKSF